MQTVMYHYRKTMTLSAFRITRFQFARDRTLGDSQVRTTEVNVAAIELIADDGLVGLGFLQGLLQPLPDQPEIERIFRQEAWPDLEGQAAIACANRVSRPRGGNLRASALPF